MDWVQEIPKAVDDAMPLLMCVWLWVTWGLLFLLKKRQDMLGDELAKLIDAHDSACEFSDGNEKAPCGVKPETALSGESLPTEPETRLD